MYKTKRKILDNLPKNPNIILRKICVMNKLPESVKDAKREFCPKSLDELKLLKDKCWIWTGSYTKNSRGVSYPRYRKTSPTRILYSLFRIELSIREWKLHPINRPHNLMDVNPYKFKLANGYEDYYDLETPEPPALDSNAIIEEAKEAILDYNLQHLDPTVIQENLGHAWTIQEIKAALSRLV